MNDWRMYTDITKEDQNHTAWHEVLRAIAQLNGTTHTLVHAAYGDHVDLVVSGGNEGQVLVQWKEYDGIPKHFILTQDKPDGLMTTVTIEGEQVPIPLAWSVPLEKVVPVCGDILRTCDLKEVEGLTWTLIEGGE
jgi:hypothetical protein